jgi:transposase
VLPEGRSWRINYTPEGLARLLDQLEQVAPALIAMEASGGYERACADCLAGAGLAVAVVNPRLVRRFAGSLGKLAKTDQIDAAIIARYAAFARPANCHTPDPEHAALMALAARRRQVVAMIVMEKQISALIASHAMWARITAALQNVTGVGPQTATTIITHLPQIGTLNRRQAAALAGLAPINRDSGSKRGRRFVQGGRQPLKTALYLAALSAARFHPTLKPFYTSLRNAGKAPTSALIAVARKLLIILNATARQAINTP